MRGTRALIYIDIKLALFHLLGPLDYRVLNLQRFPFALCLRNVDVAAFTRLYRLLFILFVTDLASTRGEFMGRQIYLCTYIQANQFSLTQLFTVKLIYVTGYINVAVNQENPIVSEEATRSGNPRTQSVSIAGRRRANKGRSLFLTGAYF